MGDLDSALGPNSELTIGINKLSDPRYRYLGINMLCIGMGLRLTLRKIRLQIEGDPAPIPSIMSNIRNYIDVLNSARQEAEMYGLSQIQGLRGDAFAKRRDHLVQQLYQGDDSVVTTARVKMQQMLNTYERLLNPR